MSNPLKPPPRPGQVKVFKALYDYVAQREDELSFREDDLLYIVDTATHKNWCKAKCNTTGREGLVPYNYIEESMQSVLNPLHEACKRGNVEFLKECLLNNVSVNSLDKIGNTPLHWACNGGHLECVHLLLKSNKNNNNINVQNRLGETPLHIAAYKNHKDIIELLLKNEAKIDLLNKDFKVPYDCARDNECRCLLQLNSIRKELAANSNNYLNENEQDDDDDDD